MEKSAGRVHAYAAYILFLAFFSSVPGPKRVCDSHVNMYVCRVPGAVWYVQFAVHKILTYVSCCNGELQHHCCVDVLVSRTSLLLSIGVCFLRVTCQSWGTVCVIPSTILCVLELRWRCVVPMFI